jgi:uncharacterized Fe-S cluster protein YjdI
MDEIVREYSNGEITVIWKQHKCIHSAVCVKKLPTVFHPAHRPWVNIQGSNTESIRETVDLCPSGALTYRMNNEIMEYENNETAFKSTQIKVVPNGPLLVSGPAEITDQNGNTETKTTIFALCRCGASHKKPYCDGTHNFIGFKD